MPIRHILPGEDFIGTYRAPETREQVLFRVESDRQVDVFILPDVGLERFYREDDDKFDCYRASENKTRHMLRFTPNPGERWHAVISNFDEESEAVVFFEAAW